MIRPMIDASDDPAAQARALVGATNVATLATLSADGHPWASLVAYGVLSADGSPVLCVSSMAEHGRNLARDPRASLLVAGAAPAGGGDPLEAARVTLAGRAVRPEGDAVEAARAAYLAAVPGSDAYIGFADFTLWVLDVERLRWVGGFGRMGSADGAAYAAATVR
jgi:putative heme iron utilization protein